MSSLRSSSSLPVCPSPVASPPVALRIGIVQDRAIVRQQRVLVGSRTQVGPRGVADPSGTVWVVPGVNGLRLEVPEGTPVRIGRHGQVLRPQTGPSQPVALQPGDQVRVDVGSAIVLMQVVVSQASVEPLAMGSFRPLLVEPGDPLYLGLLSFWGTVAGVLLVVAAATPVVEMGTAMPPPERILMVLRPPVATPDVVDSAPAVDQNAVVETTSEPEPEPEPVEVAEVPQRVPLGRAARLDALKKRSSVLNGLGALQERLHAGTSEAALDAALEGVGGPAPIAAKGGAGGLLAARGGDGRSDAGLDWRRVGPKGGNPPEGQLAPVTDGIGQAPRARTAAVSLQPAGSDVSGVLARVQKVYSARLKRCYERRLAELPSLRGRVELSFDVEAGAIAFAAVSGNDTGDAGLADCIEASTRRWRFDDGQSGSFVLPMVFEPG